MALDGIESHQTRAGLSVLSTLVILSVLLASLAPGGSRSASEALLFPDLFNGSEVDIAKLLLFMVEGLCVQVTYHLPAPSPRWLGTAYSGETAITRYTHLVNLSLVGTC